MRWLARRSQAVNWALKSATDSKLRPDRWNVGNVMRRLGAKGDPWADISSYARGISRAQRRIDSLLVGINRV